MRNRLVWVLAITCGLTVANMYYIQPLLANISRAFAITQGQAGLIATLLQFGYALGLLLLVPLGDGLDRRSLACTALIGVTICLAATALAPTAAWLALISFVLGLTGVVPQILVPFAAGLARPEARGRVVGTVMSGLLIGILLARTVSGLVGQLYGWRTMFWVAAGLMLLLQGVLRYVLPPDPCGKSRMTYAAIFRSIWQLARDEPTVREASAYGGLFFGAFNAFWVTLAFFLATPPYHFGSGVVGLFGLAGVGGALAASFTGRLAERVEARRIAAFAMGIGLASFAICWLGGYHLWGLAAGVLLLDLGTQAAHISNQTRIYSLDPQLHSRVNTIYMVSYFVGGSLGSAVGAWAWSTAGWHGVCAAGILFLACGLGIHALFGPARQHAVAPG
jgi:predicted MFS family arabinose efflux permease